MKMKYFPLTFLGAGLLGALCGGLFCNIFLQISGMLHPLSPNTRFGLSFALASTSLYAAVASTITSMIFWGIIILIPNRLSVGRGVAAGTISAIAAIPILTIIKFSVQPDGYFNLPFNFSQILYGLFAGLYGIIVVGIMSCGTLFLVGGIAGWLYVLLVRRVFSLSAQLLPPIQ